MASSDTTSSTEEKWNHDEAWSRFGDMLHLNDDQKRALKDWLSLLLGGEDARKVVDFLAETGLIVETFVGPGGFPDRTTGEEEKIGTLDPDQPFFTRKTIHNFHFEDRAAKETKMTRIHPSVTEVPDAWTDVSVVMTWNMWGMAPVDAVQDSINDVKDRKENVGAGLINLTKDDFLGILQVKPFEQRVYQDKQLLTILHNEYGADFTNPDPTFFAISGYQEAWIFAPEYSFLTATRDGHDHQDRFRRAAYLTEEEKHAYPHVDMSHLFRGWKWYIGTDNAFRESESTEPPFAEMTHEFSGRFSGTDPGLLLLSTHEPHAFGYQEFSFKPDRKTDLLAMKGFLWGFWKNDARKGVLAITTHFLTGHDKSSCVEDLEQLILHLAKDFSSHVEDLDVYAFGDFNWEAYQILSCSKGVLTAMSHLTGYSRTTKDGDKPTDSHRLDHIFGGKFIRDDGHGNPDRLTDLESAAGMKPFVVPPGTGDYRDEQEEPKPHTSFDLSKDTNNDHWDSVSTDPKKYRQGMSDHKMAVVVRENLP